MVKRFNPILHGSGGRNPPFLTFLRKFQNNTENSQNKGVAEIFREPNLVLKNL